MYIPSTINEQLEKSKTLKVTHRNLNSYALVENSKKNEVIKIPFNALFSKFKDYFDPIIEKVPLTEEEQNKFRFSPKRFSLFMYNTVEYWSLILYINDCPSVIDFDLEEVYFVLPDKIEKFIEELRILDTVR